MERPFSVTRNGGWVSFIINLFFFYYWNINTYLLFRTETGKRRAKRKPKSGDSKDKPQPRKKRTVKPKEGEDGDKVNKPKRAYKKSKLVIETKPQQEPVQTTLPQFINTNVFPPPVINVASQLDFATAFNNAFTPNSPDRMLPTNPTEPPKTPTFNKVIPDPNKTPGKKKKIYPTVSSKNFIVVNLYNCVLTWKF